MNKLVGLDAVINDRMPLGLDGSNHVDTIHYHQVSNQPTLPLEDVLELLKSCCRINNAMLIIMICKSSTGGISEYFPIDIFETIGWMPIKGLINEFSFAEHKSAGISRFSETHIATMLFRMIDLCTAIWEFWMVRSLTTPIRVRSPITPS